jgi:hypothetical protein
MSMLQRSILVVAMVVLPLTRAQPAWGQGPPTTVPPADTTAVSSYTFKPLFTAITTAPVSSVTLGGDFRHTFMMANGLRLQTTLGTEKEDFRLQARTNERKRFQNTLLHRFGTSGWMADLNHMDSRMFNRVVSVSGGIQDVVLNSLTVSGSLRYASINPDNFRWDGRLMMALADAEKTFKTDRSMGGETGGGFGVNLFNEFLVVNGRGYFKNIDVSSSSIYEQFDNLFLKEDSMSADVSLHFSEGQVAKFTYDDFNAIEKFTDQARGSQGGQIQGAENLLVESRFVDARVMNVGFDSKMSSRLNFKINAQHSDELTDYAITKTRFSHNITDFLRGNVTYGLFTGTEATVKMDLTKTRRDLGPESVSSQDRRTRDLDVSLNHAFSPTFSVNLSGGALLMQTFYLRFKDNPRDQDQLEYSANLRIRSRPFRKISASIGSSFIRTEFISIHYSLSSNNRVKTRYDLRPTITYNVNERISITQNYGLAIEFTDHTFIPADNFLDRNATFSNDVRATITKNLRGVFFYSFHYHDRGSYLSEEEGGERFLNREREDRRDQVRLEFDYRLTTHFTVLGKQEYSRRKDRTVGSSSVRVTEDGGIEVGFRGNYDWQNSRSLRFTVKKANRFGSFSAEAQKDYWIVDAEFKYAF